jgi:putative hemolysin
LFIQKLYVTRSLVKVFAAEDTLLVDRTQILEVTDHYILVRDTDVRVTDEEPAGALGTATA